ncbi:hypothetical protein ACFVAJ_17900 [Agromyces sp. NPDC057679]|uniref:hypothetical protein n=1 Tax=Agromyces sp. NPDC057679 TaxID=3346207 RepID=UPI00366C28DE
MIGFEQGPKGIILRLTEAVAAEAGHAEPRVAAEPAEIAPRPVAPHETLTGPQKVLLERARQAASAGKVQHMITGAQHRVAAGLEVAGYITVHNSFFTLTEAGASAPEYIEPHASAVVSLPQLTASQRKLLATIANSANPHYLVKHENSTAVPLRRLGLIEVSRRTATITDAGKALL